MRKVKYVYLRTESQDCNFGGVIEKTIYLYIKSNEMIYSSVEYLLCIKDRYSS